MFAPQRSQSTGPGLSINTGAANSLAAPNANQPATGGLFGSKPAGSLFGSTASAAPSAGTLFGTTTTSTAGPSLFGATTSAPSQAGTLFGGTATTQPRSTSMFGNTAAAPATTSLFGNSASTQAQQTTNTSLFGNTNTQPQQTTSLFGGMGQQQSQPAQQTTSLFGGTGQQQQSQQPLGGSLFGASTQQPQNNTSLFGGQQGATSFGASQSKALFGASQNTQGGFQQSTLNPGQRTQRSALSQIGAYTAEQQTVPGVRINLSELKPTTRFNDLYEGVQKEIENIDTFIYNQIRLSEECEGLMPHNANTIATIPPDVELCSRRLEVLERSLETDAAAIDEAKRLARKDTEAARISFKAIAAIRTPAQFQNGGLLRGSSSGTGSKDDSSNDLLSYFNNQSDEMSQKLDTMKRQLAEVESYLSSMESQQIAQIQSTRLSHGRDGGVKSAEDQIREMASTLQSFEGGILNVASRITSARESLGGLMVGDSTGRRGR